MTQNDKLSDQRPMKYANCPLAECDTESKCIAAGRCRLVVDSTPAPGSASSPTWEEIIIAQVLANLNALPDDWGNYSPHWRCGYNQARKKVAALLKARTPNSNVSVENDVILEKPSSKTK